MFGINSKNEVPDKKDCDPRKAIKGKYSESISGKNLQETVSRTRESERRVTSGSRDSGRELIQSRDVTLPPAKFVARVERTNTHSDSK